MKCLHCPDQTSSVIQRWSLGSRAANKPSRSVKFYNHRRFHMQKTIDRLCSSGIIGRRHKSHKEWAALGIYARHSMMTRDCETQSSSWGFVSSSTGLLKTRVCAGLCLPIEHCDYKILKYADSTAPMFSVLWLLLGHNPQQQHCGLWLDNALVMDPHEVSWYRVLPI